MCILEHRNFQFFSQRKNPEVYFYHKSKFIFYHKMQITKKIKQDSNTKANKSGEEAQKKPWGLYILGSLRVKNKVNSICKARIKGKNTIKAGIG